MLPTKRKQAFKDNDTWSIIITFFNNSNLLAVLDQAVEEMYLSLYASDS